MGRMQRAYSSVTSWLFRPLTFVIELLGREDIGFAVVDGVD